MNIVTKVNLFAPKNISYIWWKVVIELLPLILLTYWKSVIFKHIASLRLL